MNKKSFGLILFFIVGHSFLFLETVFAQSSQVQISYGRCSPNISHVAGSVTITCSGALSEADRQEIEQHVQAAIKRGGAKNSEAMRKTAEDVIRDELGSRFLSKSSEYGGAGRLSVTVDLSPETERDPKALAFQATHDAGLYAGRLFVFRDSIRLSEQGEQALSLLARGLARLKPKLVVIQGHLSESCPQRIANKCQKGYREKIGHSYAQKLSEKVASAVKEYFSEQGVDRGLIYTEGAGFNKPLSPYPTGEDLTPENWEAAASKNFRADILIQL